MSLFDSFNSRPTTQAQPSNMRGTLFTPQSLIGVAQLTDQQITAVGIGVEREYSTVVSNYGKQLSLTSFGELGTLLTSMVGTTNDLDISTIRKNRTGLLAWMSRTIDDIRAEIMSRTSTAEDALTKISGNVRSEITKIQQHREQMKHQRQVIVGVINTCKGNHQKLLTWQLEMTGLIQSMSQSSSIEEQLKLRDLQSKANIIESLITNVAMRIQQLEMQALDCQTQIESTQKLVMYSEQFLQHIPDMLLSLHQYAAAITSANFANKLSQLGDAHNSMLVQGNAAVNSTAITVEQLLNTPIIKPTTLDQMRNTIANTTRELANIGQTRNSDNKMMLVGQTSAHQTLFTNTR